MLSISHGPGPPLFSHSLSLSTRVAVDGAGAGGEGELLVVWWNATARSIAFFLSSTLFVFFPLSFLSSLHFPLCERGTSEAEKKKEKEREKQASISPARRQQQLLFYLPSEGPDDSSGRARWMKRKVCVRACVCVGLRGVGGIPRDSPQISPGNCSTMSLRIREQPQPLLGSLRDGDL